jgi:hypothetical protein
VRRPAGSLTATRPRRTAAALVAGGGVVIALALAVAAARYADATALSPIRPRGGWRLVYDVAIVAAFAAYLVGLIALRRRATSLAAVVCVVAAIQLVPLAGPLLLSTDAYSYWDYGRIAAVHHGNPYSDLPRRWPRDPAYRAMGADWRGRTSVYGPVFTLSSEADARLAGGSGRHATLGFRVLAALAMVALALLTAAAAGRRSFAAAFVGWNPLLALHFGGGGHNDVLMMLFVAGGLALGAARRPAAEGAAWALAAAVKPIAFAFLPLRLLAAYVRRPALRAAALGFGAAAGAVALVASLRYGFAWLRLPGPLSNQLRETSSLGLPYRLERAGVSVRLARDGLAAAFAVFYVWLLREAWRGRSRLGLCAVGLLVTASWLQPWYAVWALPLAAVEGDVVAGGAALVLSAYLLRDVLPS